jgi:AraC family transcriptional regulator
MNAVDWQSERARFEGNVAAQSREPHRVISNSSGTVLITRAKLESSEGPHPVSPCLAVSLCIDGSGRFLRSTELGRVEGTFTPGTFGLALPGTKGSGFTPRADMLGLAVGIPEMTALGLDLTSENFIAAASKLRNDPLVSAVMRAMWMEAEVHGASSLFFQHGLAVILRRLAEIQDTGSRDYLVKPLAGQRLAQILELIESQIGSDLNIGELAAEARQDVRTFTRAFRAATGFAPYAYLTVRRMERAKQLLLTERSITDIAMSTGYANPSKFAAAFRRLHDCSPRDWRRANR